VTQRQDWFGQTAQQGLVDIGLLVNAQDFRHDPLAGCCTRLRCLRLVPPLGDCY
jgi:hypothetical protein